MPIASTQLQVIIWDGYAKTNLMAELTGPYSVFSFMTALHGGFKECHITVPMPYTQAWLALNRDEAPGWHFHHLEVLDGPRVVWEGRIMTTAIVGSESFEGLQITAFGYWSSLRDQYYDDQDGTSTNWASSSGGSDDVIKDMVPTEAPDISSDTTQINANTNDVLGITELHTRKYPMDHIVDTLAPTADTGNLPWYAAIWEDRVLHWKERATAKVDWFVHRSALASYRLEQDGTHLRNAIMPVKGGTEGTVATDTDSLGRYPRRELQVTVPAGVSSTVENDMRDTVLARRKKPRQSQSFIIKGAIFGSRIMSHRGPIYRDTTAVAGARAFQNKWWVRAGHIIRIEDLVPSTISGTALDDLRTFFLLETTYDVISDTLTVVPDRPALRLSSILAREITIESDKI